MAEIVKGILLRSEFDKFSSVAVENPRQMCFALIYFAYKIN